jgi:hypothetical protein
MTPANLGTGLSDFCFPWRTDLFLWVSYSGFAAKRMQGTPQIELLSLAV